MNEVLILEGARTPFATWAGGVNGRGEKGGALKPLDPFDLGAVALKGALEKSGIPAARLDKVVFGNMYHVGANACYGARYVSLRAGIPPEVPSVTTSFACGTGLQAVMAAAEDIAYGRSRLVGTGGTDNTSLVPRAVFVPSFKDLACGEHIAKTAQDMAEDYGFSREDQDAWARASHERARKARAAGVFAAEIVPAGGVEADDNIQERDEPRYFSESKLLFEGGTVTHANTHGIVDGASALVLASGSEGSQGRRPPLGRYLGGELAAVEPRRMAFASVPAVRRLLQRLGLEVKDFDLFEINETFAAQLLIDMKELGLPPERVNVNGGALALGHPFGGTGARQVLTLLRELARRNLRRGLASICVGGGQGIAVAVERV